MKQPRQTGGPPKTWPHRKLYDRILDALNALPARFKTSLTIAGISATDLFTLNTPLGAAIEQSVVESLNDMRSVWDPDGSYERYTFVRQAQVFPDVRLQTNAPSVPESERVLLGVELKGWFVLAKEGEPSFRYNASPLACAVQDILVVYPWTLTEVISGSPRLLRPFIEEARFAAEKRNYYWSVERGLRGNEAAIKTASHQTPYPIKKDKFNDEPVVDSGKNFGRVARSGIMTDFIKELLLQPLSGIPAFYWQRFFTIFAEGVSSSDIERKIVNLQKEAVRSGLSADRIEALEKAIEGIMGLITRT